MKRIFFLLLVVALCFGTAHAAEPIIEDGFRAFKESGVAAAWNAWAKGGPMEGSKELAAQASQFGQIGAYYGGYSSHSYISQKDLGSCTKIVFLVMNLEKGPLFGRFLMFKNAEGVWTLPSFRFHTEPERIWPAEVYAD